MIVATGVELRAGARLLVGGASFRVGPGQRVGLVGRNGAGKTTLTKVLAGETPPAGGTVTRTGDVGYLPQDPRTGDPEVLVRDRILSMLELNNQFHAGQSGHAVSVSIGMATCRAGDQLEAAVMRADRAMYEDKARHYHSRDSAGPGA
jgi:ATPase subunit of ABC transporter with duplicated ATPase domains